MIMSHTSTKELRTQTPAVSLSLVLAMCLRFQTTSVKTTANKDISTYLYIHISYSFHLRYHQVKLNRTTGQSRELHLPDTTSTPLPHSCSSHRSHCIALKISYLIPVYKSRDLVLLLFAYPRLSTALGHMVAVQ